MIARAVIVALMVAVAGYALFETRRRNARTPRSSPVRPD